MKLLAAIIITVVIGVVAQTLVSPTQIRGTTNAQAQQLVSYLSIPVHQADSTWTFTSIFPLSNASTPAATFLIYYNGVYQNSDSVIITLAADNVTWVLSFPMTNYATTDKVEVRYFELQ